VPRQSRVEFLCGATPADSSRGSNAFLGSCWNSEKFKRRNPFPGTLGEYILLVVAPSLFPCCGCLLENDICGGWKTSTINMLWRKPHECSQPCVPVADSTEPYRLWGSWGVSWGPTLAATRLSVAVWPARLVWRAEASLSVYQLRIFIFSKYLLQANWPSIVWERWGTGWESFGWDCASSKWWLRDLRSNTSN